MARLCVSVVSFLIVCEQIELALSKAPNIGGFFLAPATKSAG